MNLRHKYTYDRSRRNETRTQSTSASQCLVTNGKNKRPILQEYMFVHDTVTIFGSLCFPNIVFQTHISITLTLSPLLWKFLKHNGAITWNYISFLVVLSFVLFVLYVPFPFNKLSDINVLNKLVLDTHHHYWVWVWLCTTSTRIHVRLVCSITVDRIAPRRH